MRTMPVSLIVLPALAAIAVASALLFANGSERDAYALHACAEPATSGSSHTDGCATIGTAMPPG